LEEMPNYVIIGQPEFFDALNKIIEKTSIEDIKTYLRWQTLVSTAPLLHREAAKVIFDFFGREIAGTKKQRPRWKRAISLMGSLIGDALSELYVKENFGHEAKEKAASLITNIKRAFRERLEKLEWMSDDTKVKAIEKLDAMNVKLGYPKKFKDYLKLEINRNDLFGNYIRAYQFELDRTMKRIGKKVDKNEWDMNAYTVNAYYDATKNEIVIPAGILQPPFFDAKIDNAVNYGGIGGTIGHEITHGFDDDGSLYDKYGNINEWWSKQDRKKFNNLTKRIEDLYGSLEIKPGLKVNGKLTLGENIADLGGIHIAYDALQRSISNSKVNSRIDGFTQEQRFYIAWAQIWKLKITDNLMILNAKIDPHSPSRLRGSIPVITHHDFIKTFRENSALKEPSPKYGDVNLW
jgi:putative endopeptidase